jgi:hypothetical protein
VLGFNGLLLIQDDVGGRRLSQALQHADESTYEGLLENALSSQARIHQIGSTAGLDRSVVSLGVSRKWLTALIDRPAIIGNYLQIPCPAPAIDDLHDLLAVYKPRFIKWDARPGNAILAADRTVNWIDWEHCGARNRLDDVAWLLCDESTPEFPDAEDRLLARHVPLFADCNSAKQAFSYLRAYGVMHICIRLAMILTEHANEGWLDFNDCLQNDRTNVSPEAVRRLCQRGVRWASQEPTVRVLGTWFEQVGRRLADPQFSVKSNENQVKPVLQAERKETIGAVVLSKSLPSPPRRPIAN